MKYILLATCFLFSTVNVNAGTDHHHGSHSSEPRALNEEEVLVRAKKTLPQLVEQGFKINGTALNESWKDVSLNSKVKEQGPDYYIISFKGNDEQILYFLMSSSGNFYEANFTGAFEGINL